MLNTAFATINADPILPAGAVWAADQFLPYRLHRAAAWVGRQFAVEYRARYQLTQAQWFTLTLLGGGEHMTASAVAQHTGMHKSKISRAVKALEARRWISRTTDDNDHRIEHLEITPHGRQAFVQLGELAQTYTRQLQQLIGETGDRQMKAGLAALERVMASTT